MLRFSFVVRALGWTDAGCLMCAHTHTHDGKKHVSITKRRLNVTVGSLIKRQMEEHPAG